MFDVRMRILLTLSLFLMLVGCSSDDTTASDKGADVLPQTTRTENFKYFDSFHQGKCDQNQRELLRDATVYNLYDGIIEPRVLSFGEEFQAKPNLSDINRNIISKTLYNRKEVTLQEMLYDEDEELIGFLVPNVNVEDEGRNLFVCPRIEIPRESVENMAIGINYRILKSYNALNLSRPDFKLKPIEVYVQNIEEKVFETYVKEKGSSEEPKLKSKAITYSTDNAYYSGSSIHFLPQSDDARDGKFFTMFPLWEIPFVASHEYGHHVFETILKTYGLSNINFVSGCFHSFDKTQIIKEYDSSFQTGFKRLPQNSRYDALRALHEGFADLFAHYTLGLEGQLNGVNCFSESRNVMSPFFGNGDFKEFDSKSFNVFIDNEAPNVFSCDEPNFTQYHTVGAVFARVVYAILENEGLSDTESLRVVMNWAEDLAVSVREDMGAEVTFSKAKSSFISTYLKFIGRDSLTRVEKDLVENSLSFDL